MHSGGKHCRIKSSCTRLQKARLARIRIAKASSGAAFVSKKKAAEARLAAQESGIELDDTYREEDIFELQHHHLLRCLEKTTASDLRRLSFFTLLTNHCCYKYSSPIGSRICRTGNAIQWPTQTSWLTVATCKPNTFYQQYYGLDSIVLWTMLFATLSGMCVVNA